MEVRAFIVVLKPGNAGGAKGRRKMKIVCVGRIEKNPRNECLNATTCAKAKQAGKTPLGGGLSDRMARMLTASVMDVKACRGH